MLLHTEVGIDATPAQVSTVLEVEPGRTRLVQAEKFRGLALPLLAKHLRADTLPRFEEMNHALKVRAEALAAQSGR